MILLVTDHLSVFTDERDPRHGRLNRRTETAADQVACTIALVNDAMLVTTNSWCPRPISPSHLPLLGVGPSAPDQHR